MAKYSPLTLNFLLEQYWEQGGKSQTNFDRLQQDARQFLRSRASGQSSGRVLVFWQSKEIRYYFFAYCLTDRATYFANKFIVVVVLCSLNSRASILSPV
jgi:hypothetical protein